MSLITIFSPVQMSDARSLEEKIDLGKLSPSWTIYSRIIRHAARLSKQAAMKRRLAAVFELLVLAAGPFLRKALVSLFVTFSLIDIFQEPLNILQSFTRQRQGHRGGRVILLSPSPEDAAINK